MRRLLILCIVLASAVVAADKPSPRDASLGKKEGTSVDTSLAGDITRKKTEDAGGVPLQYDQFRLGVELQVADKRREQIDSLRKIIELSPDPKEAPSLLFRLGELYWEESRYYFFEANRKDDDLIRAINAKDVPAQERVRKEKAQVMVQRDAYAKLAVGQYTEIVQRYKDYERTDEVLFLLGHNLLELGEDKKGLIAYNRLIEKYPNSKYLADAYLAFGEYYFNASRGKREWLSRALEFYKKAANYPDNQVYGFALYKQGWCYFNLADYPRAMDLYKAVVLYGEFAGASMLEKTGGTKGKNTLIKEARSDFVRAYERSEGTPDQAKEVFGTVASNPEDRFTMMKQLANLYYDDGRDRDAAVTFDKLIKERPLIAETPGWQGKIVDCVLRAGNKKQTVSQVRRLVKIMNDVERSGNVKTDKDHKSLADARDLSERTLSNLAVNWHNEAKKTRDDETFEFANEVYGDYLALFVENSKAYDLRFFWAELLNDNLRKYPMAAEQYRLVVIQDGQRIDGVKDEKGGWRMKPGKPGKWLTYAAYDAVLASDEVVKRAEEKGEIKPPPATELAKRIEMPAQKKALLEDCERYLKYLPRGEKRVEIAYKAAKIYYDHHRYDEAVFRFSEIALSHPEYKFENGDRAGEIAANLVLDSYNGLQNYAKVNEWARRFYANDKLATGKFRDELSRVIEQSSFKLVHQLEEKKEYAAAAQAYLDFVKDFPKTEIADKALYNASTDFYKAHLLERALETREKIFRNYPNSSLVPLCTYANAEGHEAIGDFERAAEAYEAYVRGYEKSLGPREKAAKQAVRRKTRRSKLAAKPEPAKKDPQVWEESKAQIALFNAGVYREGLGQLKQALRNREHFLELWPDGKDADAVSLSIADLYERMGQYGRAVAHLEQRAKDNEREPSKALAAQGRVLAIYEGRLKNPRAAARTEKQVLESYDKLYRRQKEALEPPAREVVAKATLHKNEEQFVFFTRQRLHWGRMPDPAKDFKESIKVKTKSLQEIERLYTATVALKAGDPAICALEKIGRAYENMGESIANAPMPRYFPPEVQDALREQLANESNPVKAKAADFFAAAVAKSRELAIHNGCSKRSLLSLRNTYRPDQYPAVSETVVDLPIPRRAEKAPPLLAEIQPAVADVSLQGTAAVLSRPVVTRSAVRPARNVREDEASDLRAGQKPKEAARVAPTEKTTPASSVKSGSEEPEDLKL